MKCQEFRDNCDRFESTTTAFRAVMFNHFAVCTACAKWLYADDEPDPEMDALGEQLADKDWSDAEFLDVILPPERKL